MIAGAAISHNFGLAGNADSVVDGVYKVGGISDKGKIVVCAGLVILLVISLINIARQKKTQNA